VGRTEGVIDVEIERLGHSPRDLRVARRLAFVKAQVLEQTDVAGAEPTDQLGGWLTQAILGEGYLSAQKFGEPPRDRRQAEFRPSLALRPAQVAGARDFRAAICEQLQRRKCGPDATVVRDRDPVERDVEVDAAEDRLAASIEVFHRAVSHDDSPCLSRSAHRVKRRIER
jgi:hypothetical protein